MRDILEPELMLLYGTLLQYVALWNIIIIEVNVVLGLLVSPTELFYTIFVSYMYVYLIIIREYEYFCIGDAGYPLEPWLMTPLPHYPEGTRQFQYTEELCKARNVVERCFGILKMMWRCLSYQRVLMYEPSFAGRIVNACTVLHNMRIHYRLPLPDYDEAAVYEIMDNNHNNRHEENILRQQGPRAVARRIQQQIMRERFPQLHDADEEN